MVFNFDPIGFCDLSWYRIVSVSAPRMTSEQTSYCKIQSLERAVFSECFQRILGTGGGESACGGLERGYADLIESDQNDEREDGNLPDCL